MLLTFHYSNVKILSLSLTNFFENREFYKLIFVMHIIKLLFSVKK